jgi:hypothetical protein
MFEGRISYLGTETSGAELQQEFEIWPGNAQISCFFIYA